MKLKWGLLFVALLVLVLTTAMCLPEKGKTMESDVTPDSTDVVEKQPEPPEDIDTRDINRAKTAFVDLAKFATPAVVNINVTKTVKAAMNPFGHNDEWFKFFEPFMGPQRDFKQRGLGSGFIIDKQGHIVTNNHVVQDADEITVTLQDETKVNAAVVGTDPKTDIALIKINEEDLDKIKDIPHLDLGDSEALQVGEWVIAIGNPFGLQHTVTAGIVSAKGRIIGAGPYDDFIQTDASINPGNSGGPLINTAGKVIGINTLINASGQGIGFAIPSSQAKNVITQLMDNGSVTRGWLGVYIQPITPDLAKALGLDETKGALVSQVIPDSPAKDAAIKPEDVIISFDGKQIDKNSELPTVVADTPVGSKVDVEIIRDGKSKTLKVVVGEMPQEKITASEKENKDLGLTVQNITPEVAAKLGVRTGEGVVISQVGRGTPAQEAGLAGGDIILKVNRTSISSTEEFYNQIEQAPKGMPILLLVKREDGNHYTTINPE